MLSEELMSKIAEALEVIKKGHARVILIEGIIRVYSKNGIIHVDIKEDALR